MNVKRKPISSALEALVGKIAGIMNRDAASRFPAGESADAWKFAILDKRYSDDGTMEISKCVIQLNGGKRCVVRESDNVLELCRDLAELRDKLGPDKWYGIIVTAFPNGENTVELNTDSRWIEDERFFDDYTVHT